MIDNKIDASPQARSLSWSARNMVQGARRHNTCRPYLPKKGHNSTGLPWHCIYYSWSAHCICSNAPNGSPIHSHLHHPSKPLATPQAQQPENCQAGLWPGLSSLTGSPAHSGGTNIRDETVCCLPGARHDSLLPAWCATGQSTACLVAGPGAKRVHHHRPWRPATPPYPSAPPSPSACSQPP